MPAALRHSWPRFPNRCSSHGHAILEEDTFAHVRPRATLDARRRRRLSRPQKALHLADGDAPSRAAIGPGGDVDAHEPAPVEPAQDLRGSDVQKRSEPADGPPVPTRSVILGGATATRCLLTV